MKKVAIVGLGWLGMPLALALAADGMQVVGSKTTPDGVDAARMAGVECYPLEITPEMAGDAEDLAQLLDVDALVITLPARRTPEGSRLYLQAVQLLVDSALAHQVKRIIVTSSTAVYGDQPRDVDETTPLDPVTHSGRALAELEVWLNQLPNIAVDILRLGGLVGQDRHPGRFLAGKTGIKNGSHGVNLVHQDDVIAAIRLLLRHPDGNRTYNLCAPQHPPKAVFYRSAAARLGLTPPQFEPDDQSAGKVVDGSRICRELGFAYQFPDPDRMPVS
ncbi:MAG: SDR family oxidoreductase [Yersiniaceae bacterium]|nr:SDR family oxidoreductase [Yersiniaceae bacterium]